MKLLITQERFHVWADYLWAFLVVIMSWTLLPSSVGNIMLVCGLSIGIYSLFTAYGGGLVNVLSFRAHLMLDFLISLVLIVGPLLTNDNYKLMPIGLGISGLFLALSGSGNRERYNMESQGKTPAGHPLS